MTTKLGIMIIKLIALAGLTFMIIVLAIVFVCSMSKCDGHKFFFWRD